MSRVSEAMKRAGYQHQDHVGSPPEESAFVTGGSPGEGRFDDGVAYTDGLHLPEEPPSQSPHPAAPSEVTRGTAEDIRILEVLRIFYRRRWAMAAVVCVALGIAVVYNFFAPRIYEARARVL